MAGTSIKNIVRMASTVPALIIAVVANCVPQRVTWMMGCALGHLFSLFPTHSRRIAVRNIELCFPEMSPENRRRLVRRHFRMCGVAMLSIGAAWWAPEWRLRSLVKTRDQHHLDRLLADGRSVILLAPHLVALEICGVRVSLDRKIVTMYRRSKNPLLDRLSRRRGRFGIVLVERGDSLRPLIQRAREGSPLYYLPDQDLAGSTSVFAPFCGIAAFTVTALSRIARMTGAAVVPCIPRILPGGLGYEVRFLEPLVDFPTDDPEQDARRMNLDIERWMREMPEQYMWTYRRFKTRPKGEPSIYAKN